MYSTVNFLPRIPPQAGIKGSVSKATLASISFYLAPMLVASDQVTTSRRFFSDSSYWNQPICEYARTDPKSEEWIQLLQSEPTGDSLVINCETWTIPVYEVNASTPLVSVGPRKLSQKDKETWHTDREHFGHGKGFDMVPIPAEAIPDSEGDAHCALVDWNRKLVWDMWGLHKDSSGAWSSATGMVYEADGMGVFNATELGVKNGESVHFHGPSRAAGVPAVAGLIMYDELLSGEIRHKIAAASRFCAFQEFVFPAAWTDGFTKGGIPEGATIQLDPKLNLEQFDLTREERIVCRALQRYGMVLVDIAQGNPIYAEGLRGDSSRTWNGKLRKTGLRSISMSHFRVLEVGEPTKMGDSRSLYQKVWD